MSRNGCHLAVVEGKHVVVARFVAKGLPCGNSHLAIIAVGSDAVGLVGPAQGDDAVRILDTDAVSALGGVCRDQAAVDGDLVVTIDSIALLVGCRDNTAVDGDLVVTIDSIALLVGCRDITAVDDHMFTIDGSSICGHGN